MHEVIPPPIGEQQNLVIYETMDSESTQGSNFLSISLNFRKLSVHASQRTLRTLSTVPDNRSLQTVKFEEWPRPNVSSFNLEILRDISPPLRNSFSLDFQSLPFLHNPVENFANVVSDLHEFLYFSRVFLHPRDSPKSRK